jgi:hypothetical protein
VRRGGPRAPVLGFRWAPQGAELWALRHLQREQHNFSTLYGHCDEPLEKVNATRQSIKILDRHTLYGVRDDGRFIPKLQDFRYKPLIH